jgi:signal transduction histidine kinase
MGSYLVNLSTSEIAVQSIAKDLELRQLIHDLQSPISAIQACLYHLEKGSEQKASVGLVKLALSRIYGLTQKQKTSWFIAGPSVEKIFEEKRVLHSTIKFQLQDDVFGARIRGDAASFERILSNLINNSLEAGAGSIFVRILEDSNSSVLLMVEDDGQGIEQSRLPFIGMRGLYFGGKERGQGLGLSGAIEIVKRWGGELVIRSELEVGTVVIIKLPQI